MRFYKIRYALALPLARVAVWLISGPDDRLVFLNTSRKRVVLNKPGAGEIRPFITQGRKVALAFPPDKPQYFPDGTAVPVIFARLAGYKIKGMGE